MQQVRVATMWRLACLLCLVPAAANAAAPQATPQIYALAGKHPDQVVMLSTWPEGTMFAEYEDPEKQTGTLFRTGQPVWTWCDGKSAANRIERLETSSGDLGLTIITLAASPGCDQRALLLSNHDLPPQRWVAKPAAEVDVARIAARLGLARNLQVTRIQSDTHGVLFLVFDPAIESIYDTGGYRLLDASLRELAIIDNAPVSPLIDLDDDGVPEFLLPSSDGMDAWLIRMFPALDRQLMLPSRPAAPSGTDPR